VAAAPNGYLNVFLDRPAFLLERLTPSTTPVASGPGKAIVEHTAINPNKAAHIGHLRNAALGDTLVRVLRFRGVPGGGAELHRRHRRPGGRCRRWLPCARAEDARRRPRDRRLGRRFDYYCWDLVCPRHAVVREDKQRLQFRADTLHDIEHGGNENAEIGAFIADRIVRCHLKTMARMNVDYDLLTWEGEHLRLKFWAQAFDVLKAKGPSICARMERLAGCWVMPIADDLESNPNPKTQIPKPKERTRSRRPKAQSLKPKPGRRGRGRRAGKSHRPIERRRDLRRQGHRLSVLEAGSARSRFRYRAFAPRPERRDAVGHGSTDGEANHPMFGGAAYVYNVIDVRQSYLQKLLKQALIAVGHPEGAERSHHFSYEMVALSHATARELGYAVAADSEEAKRAFIQVAGRKGLGVKADDLLDTLIRSAAAEVAKRNPELPAAGQARIAEMIAIAAVRYFMIKFSRGKVIAFDLQEALSFEGESGPYIQYAVVRANNIFQKLQQRDGLDEATLLKTLADVPSDELAGATSGHELWSLVLEAARLDEIVEQVIRTLEFSVLAKYAFSLAQAFNGYYNLPPSRSSILNEERDDVRRWRAAGVIYVRNQLTRALDLMGVAVPPRM
jgi:arginyl-tRNA synthetase